MSADPKLRAMDDETLCAGANLVAQFIRIDIFTVKPEAVADLLDELRERLEASSDPTPEDRYGG